MYNLYPKEHDYKARYTVISKEDHRKALSRNSVLYDGTSATKAEAEIDRDVLLLQDKNVYPLQP